MCGLTGFFSLKRNFKALPSRNELEIMTKTLIHRGPDSGNTYFSQENGLGIGHRRLAIRDTSPLGSQPMKSPCGRYIGAYNGEIYNHQEITQEIISCGLRLTGSSDTEVIMASISIWGVPSTIKKLNGMFALAVYHYDRQTLYLVRDRVGIKPLYWGRNQDNLYFASELKAFYGINSWDPKICQKSLASYMRHNYVPSPKTIFSNTFKLAPGTILIANRKNEINIETYWNFQENVKVELNSQSKLPKKELIEQTKTILTNSVKQQMVSDVPLGTLLSGGIDSTLITASANELSSKAIKTFTIGFDQKGFDEAPYARKIATHLGTEHTELYATSEDAINLAKKMPEIYDEPFADSSQIPTALLCSLTKKEVTVVLTGDGGDEIFAGYNRYTVGRAFSKFIDRTPVFSKKILRTILSSLPEETFNNIGHYLPGHFKINQLGSKLRKLSSVLEKDSADEIYLSIISHWDSRSGVIRNWDEHKGIIWNRELKNDFPDFLNRMQILDTLTYLPDDILTKVDRASMAVGLEARVPFLDNNLIKFAWSLPQSLKLKNTRTKWILRQILNEYVPNHLTNRPKMGFGVPLAEWLRGPLKEWANHLLNENKLKQENFFSADVIKNMWNAHLSGQNYSYQLWDVLMFQAWLEHQKLTYNSDLSS